MRVDGGRVWGEKFLGEGEVEEGAGSLKSLVDVRGRNAVVD